jgi:Holliday junction resolvasome RuvABC endonuclease subunit
MTIILGIDPGPAECGWMSLENDEDVPERSGPWHVHNCGNVPSKRKRVLELFEQLDPDAIAIERPKWQDHGRNAVATRAIASNLIETNYVVARIAEMVRTRGAALIEIPAQTWRLGLLNTRSPSDAQIKRALERLLAGGLPKRTNAHERDGGGIALAAARLIERKQEDTHASQF